MRGAKYEQLDTAAKAMAERLTQSIARLGLEIRVRGPMPAIISRIQSYHRMQIIIEAPTAADLQTLLADLRTQAPIRPAAQVYYDVDPIYVL
jgi:primosomal protein N'